LSYRDLPLVDAAFHSRELMMSLRVVLGGAAVITAVGVGAAILAPGMIRAARPALLRALTQGMMLARIGRARIEGVWEDLEDFVAEASATLKAEASASPVASASDSGAGAPSPPGRG
jgi:hypothetical protein